MAHYIKKEISLLRSQDIPEIEKELSKSPFMGCPMGLTLTDLIMNKFGCNYVEAGPISSIKDFIGYIIYTCYLLIPWRRNPGEGFYVSNRGKIACTWISQKSRISNLMLPVVRSMGSENTIILGASPAMSGKIPHNASFVSRKEISVPLLKWYPQYVRVSGKWRCKIRSFLKDKGIFSMGAMFKIESALLLSAYNLAANIVFLRRLQPKAVLTEYDRNVFAAPVILAARSLGIPTYTMLHGIISNALGYTPIIADYIIAWGDLSREKLISLGVAGERILLGGYPVINRQISAERNKVLSKIALPMDKPLVLLATSHMEVSKKHAFVISFCKALHERNDISLAIRLHPSESLAFYKKEISRFPKVLFMENSRLSLDESLAASDIVVCGNSGYGLDALVKSKPVIVLNTFKEPLTGAQDFVNEAGCPEVHKEDDLSLVISRILDDADFKKGLLLKAGSYFDKVFVAIGDDAADRIAKIIQGKSG